MNAIIIYLLLACLGSALFVTLDLVLLKRFASYRQRRHILIFTIISISLLPIAGSFLPLELPQIRLVYGQDEVLSARAKSKTQQIEQDWQWLPTIIIGKQDKVQELFNFSKKRTLAISIIGLWIIACLLYFFRFVHRLYTLKGLKKKASYLGDYDGNPILLIREEKQNAFSFLKTIYLTKSVWESKQREHILRHEAAHIKSGHAYDMLLAEILLLPQCFNPFASYLKQALKEVHEYQADELVLRDKAIERKAYQYNLLCFAMQGDYDPICQFFRIPYLYNNQLKNRIIMMNQERKSSSKWSYLFALPIAAVMLWGGNSCSQEKKSDKDEGMPLVENLKDNKTKAQTPTKAEITEESNGVSCGVETEESETIDGEAIVCFAEEPCEFPGGMGELMKYLGENIKYPEIAIQNEIQGRVIVSFVVSKDGSIRNAQVVKGVEASLDKEALRIVRSMPKWKPGKQDGKNINQKFTLPVIFRLA